MSANTQPVPPIFVFEDERTAGTRGPFYAAYRADDPEERFGWWCSQCETLDTRDTAGGIACNQCENTAPPSE